MCGAIFTLYSQGITDPALSIGMLWSYYNWHAEPGHLFRIEYHHCGAPRTWYSSPSSSTYEFEKVVAESVCQEEGLGHFEAFDALNFKSFLFSPNVMVKNSIPIYKTFQHPGEYIITFPRSYHMAFCHGFSLSESVNFATPEWFPMGDEASDRRALYKRDQDVPYQELLVGEVMHLHNNNKSALNSPAYLGMKVQFVCLIKMHRFAFDEMKKVTGADCSIIASGDENESLLCGVCDRGCFLAYYKCNCYDYKCCIFHDIYNRCPCKDPGVMAVREEFTKVAAVADEFEKYGDKDFREKVETLYNIKSLNFKNIPIRAPTENRENIDSPPLPENSPPRLQGWNFEVPRRQRTPRVVIPKE